ncbi:MAG: hypothetical protein CVV44_05675 [Spirochaetae bacterium HGW-Spirochaetae-1]|nr:MAG: hypothetical protein CVV44_05675 [Spirochaetae bacterium HGW-Spirochaetae-1]
MILIFPPWVRAETAVFTEKTEKKEITVEADKQDISVPEKVDNTGDLKDGDVPVEKKDEPFQKGKAGSNHTVDVQEPVKKSQISMPLLLGLDLLVPGGGHFYRGSYIMGGTFLTLKVAGAWSIYYFYKDWQYIRSLYFSAKKANAEIDPDHELLFKDPRGGYKTVKEFKRDYDSAAQNMTFTVVANVVVYGVSLAINYMYGTEYNEDRTPLFSFYYSMPQSPLDCGTMGVMYTLRY